jgi:hypothetical protein
MIDCDSHYDRVCKGEFAELHAKLDKLDEAIRGNGKPGIQLRLDRLESAEATRSRLLWIIAGSTVTLALGALWKLIFGG